MKSIDSSYLTDHLMETFSLICFWFWLNWVTIFEVFHHWMQLTETPVGRIMWDWQFSQNIRLFFSNVTGLKARCTYIAKETLTQVFFCWIFEGTLFIEHRRWLLLKFLSFIANHSCLGWALRKRALITHLF